jgi:hypothetical protein
MMKRFFLLRAAPRRLTLFAAALLIGGCTDTGIEPPREEQDTIIVPGLVVSEPSSVVADAAALASAETAGGARVAYVSAEPGTFPGAAQIRIRNLNTADAGTAVTVHEGGFDPVGILATVGDRLELAITDFGGTFRYVRVDVPARRSPVIVRTNPPKGRTDVALSIQPVVIFSEPIDPQSLDETSITLLRDGVVVSGAVALVAGSPFAVELTPEAPLEPLTAYELVVTTAVQDLDGESLPEEYRVPFTTGSHAAAAGFRISNVTTGGAFDVDGYQVRVTVAGEAPRTVALELNTSVVIEGLPPGEAIVELVDVAANCSVSGGSSRTVAIQQSAEVHLEFQAACTPPPELGAVRLVFSRWEVVDSTAERVSRVSRLWAMNADGTDLRRLTGGETWETLDFEPIVSPDGARIAFSREEETWGPTILELFAWVMDADGSNRRLLTTGRASSWSPDGSTIAIVGGVDYTNAIHLIGADGADHRTFVAGSHAVWSPDGSRIAFRRDAEGIVGGCDDPTATHEIWTISVDLTDPLLVKQFSPCSWGGHLSWSSDGRILFEDREPDEPAPLWSIRPDGSDLAQLLEPNRMHFGVFSRDGKLVTMLAGPGGPHDIFLMNVADGNVVRVTADGASGGAAFLH